MMSGKEKSTPPESEIEWTAEDEIQLFNALEGLKPVGINKYFYMVSIVDRLSKSLNRDVTTDAIWAHLRTMYNLELLDALEPLPFNNEEREFSLPENEYSALISKKFGENEDKGINHDGSAEGPRSIIAVATDNTGRDKSAFIKGTLGNQHTKEMERKIAAKVVGKKRTRGSTSLESSSPSTTPPPVQTHKRRRI